MINNRINLFCNCLTHIFVQRHRRSKLASQGIHCPYYSPQESKCVSADGEYYLGADDLEAIKLYGDIISPEVFTESEVSPLAMEMAE